MKIPPLYECLMVKVERVFYLSLSLSLSLFVCVCVCVCVFVCPEQKIVTLLFAGT